MIVYGLPDAHLAALYVFGSWSSVHGKSAMKTAAE
jgi:hypothetical protein